jgi:hypothetical protein
MAHLSYAPMPVQIRVAQRLFFAMALSGALLEPGVALADTPCGDSTCPKGYTCEAYPGPCADSRDGSTVGACETSMQYSCVEAPCTSDADCGTLMVCHTSTRESCTGTAAVSKCAPDNLDCTEDVASVDPTCTTTTASTCVPRYDLPCTVASDCGDGFTCEPQTSVMCSGSAGRTGTSKGGVGSAESGGAAGVSAGAAASSSYGGAASVGDAGVASGSGAQSNATGSTSGKVAVDPTSQAVGGAAGTVAIPTTSVTPPTSTCTTIVSDVNYCVLKVISCNADTDCPNGFTCAVSSTSGDSACSISSDGTTACTAPQVAKACVPPSYAQNLSHDDSSPVRTNGSGSTSTTSKSEPATSGSGAVTTPSPDASTSTAAATAPNTGTLAATTSTVQAPVEASPASDTPAAAASATPSGASDAAANAAAAPEDSGGCAMATSPARGRSLASLLLLAVGFAFLRGRRRVCG